MTHEGYNFQGEQAIDVSLKATNTPASFAYFAEENIIKLRTNRLGFL